MPVHLLGAVEAEDGAVAEEEAEAGVREDFARHHRRTLVKVLMGA